jgi:hypothetical protein
MRGMHHRTPRGSRGGFSSSLSARVGGSRLQIRALEYIFRVSRCIPLYPAVSRCNQLYPTVLRCIPLYLPYPAVPLYGPAVSHCIPRYPAVCPAVSRAVVSRHIPHIPPYPTLSGDTIIKNILKSTGSIRRLYPPSPHYVHLWVYLSTIAAGSHCCSFSRNMHSVFFKLGRFRTFIIYNMVCVA